MEKSHSYERPAEDLAEVFNYTERLLEHYGFNESSEIESIRSQIDEGALEDINSLVSEGL